MKQLRNISQGALEHVTLYSIMQDPMTSCGCFECICGIEPFSNGVVIANREYAGMTPLGMTFSGDGIHDRWWCSDTWIYGTWKTLYFFQEIHEG